MRFIFTLFAVLFSFAANAQTFPGLMPSDTVVCNNTALEDFGSNCQFIVFPMTPSFFTNDVPPALITRLGSRVLMGDATKNPVNVTLHPCVTSTGDWFTNWQATTSVGACAYFPFFSLVVESQSNSGVNSGGILATGQTGACSGNCGAYGLATFGVNNTQVGHLGSVWAIYNECEQISDPARGGCIAIESDLNNFFADAATPDPFTFVATTNMQVACGGSLAGVFKCGTAINITQNGSTYNAGLIIFSGSITSGAGPSLNGVNATLAISMPDLYNISWYSAASTIKTSIWGGAAGKLNIFTSNVGLNIDGVSSVSCGPGLPTAAFTVTHGIVTAC